MSVANMWLFVPSRGPNFADINVFTQTDLVNS